MGRGRARGRRLDKAFSPGAARGFASANRTAQPKRYGLAEAINAATGAAGMDTAFSMAYMPRDPRDDVPFGPSSALLPAPLDPARPDSKRPEPRLNEYPVAWNLPGNDSLPIPWATLRGAADSVDIMRRCIEIRKEQLAGLDWSITLDDQVVQGMYAASDGSQGRTDIESELRRKLLPEIERLTKLWRNPWPDNGVSFEQWVAGVMEDHLVADGVAIYPRVTYGGDVCAFELIDPTTIKLLIDYRGARPRKPYAAFQQLLYGFPRAEFSACAYEHTDENGKVSEVVEPGFTADQLYYFRENFRSFTPYGYSAVAQALISARLYLKRQGWMLAEYDDGSTPLTWLVPEATASMVDKLTARNRREWEDSLNDELAGQTRGRHRIKVGPPGFKPEQMTGVDERYKPEYDMHLIKMLAGHFGVTSTGLGFSEARGLGNSGLHEGQESVQEKASTKPDTRMIERIINDLSRQFLKMPDELRFKFVHQDAEDGEAEDAAADSQRARGTLTLNDDRKRLGKSPFTFPEADMPLVKMGDAWMPLEGMAKRAEQQAEAEQALVDDQLANSAAAREMDAAAAESEEDVEKSLELVALGRWRRKGGARRRAFICKALTPGDFIQGVPADVEFAWHEWVPDGLPDDATEAEIAKFVGADITKAFGRGNDNWRTLARDSKGRWVARGSMRLDALGPSKPEGNVLSGLHADATRRRRLAEIKTNQAARRAAEEASRPATDPDVARHITDGGIYISRRLKGMPAAARQDPPSSAYGIKVGAIGPDGVVTDDKGRAVGKLNQRVTPEQAEAGGWLEVDTGVPGASGGYRTVRAWKEPAADRQLPANDASSTIGGMTTSTRGANLSPRAQRTLESLRERGANGERMVAAMTDRGISRQDLGPLERAGLIERFDKDHDLESMREHVRLTEAGRRHLGMEAPDAPTTSDEEMRVAVARMSLPEVRSSAHGYRFDGIDYPSRKQAEAARERRAMALAVEDAAREDGPAPDAATTRGMVAELAAANGGNPVSLAELRTRMGGTREQQDATLRALAGDGDVAFFPEENQKTRDSADDSAALNVGGEPKHYINIDKPAAAIPAQRQADKYVPRHIQDARDYLDGTKKGSVLPASYLLGDISEQTYREHFTPEQQEKALAQLLVIRAGMKDDERDKPNVERGITALSNLVPADKHQALAEAEAIRRADALGADWQAALERVNTYGDEMHMDDAEGDEDRERVYQALLAQERYASKRYSDAEDVVNRVQRPRLDAEREAKGRRMFDAVTAANEARERAAAESVARQERERQQRELAATMAEQRAAELRAELIRRTPEGYAALLDGGRVNLTHKPSRDLVSAMRDQDWKLVGMVGSTSNWEAPDGRKVELITQPGGKVAARGGELGDGIHSMKAVTEYVNNRPNVARTSVADAVNPGPGISPDAPAAPREIPRREAGQAKRGDLMVVERTESAFYIDRRDAPANERKTYEVFRVTSVTRDGQPAKVSRLDWHDMDHKGTDVKHAFSRTHGKRNIIPGDQIDVAAVRESLLARTYDNSTSAKPHDDLRELSTMLRSHLREPSAAPTAVPRQRKASAPAAPPAPSVPDAAPHPQKATFDKLLDDGLVRHKQARQIVEQMEAHGWKLTDQNPMHKVTQWEAPDGRKMTVQFLTSDKPKFYPGGSVTGGNPSFKAALAHVVTPTHEEVGGPNILSAADRVDRGLGNRVREQVLGNYNVARDESLRPLETAQRQLSGYGGTAKRTPGEVAADLRSQADRLDTLAQSNTEHHARIGMSDLGESPQAVRQREQAAQFRQIADVLDQQAAERAAYEAEVTRRAGLPLDIRPTGRRAR